MPEKRLIARLAGNQQQDIAFRGGVGRRTCRQHHERRE
jgi:hypothetical protein